MSEITSLLGELIIGSSPFFIKNKLQNDNDLVPEGERKSTLAISINIADGTLVVNIWRVGTQGVEIYVLVCFGNFFEKLIIILYCVWDVSVACNVA